MRLRKRRECGANGIRGRDAIGIDVAEPHDGMPPRGEARFFAPHLAELFADGISADRPRLTTELSTAFRTKVEFIVVGSHRRTMGTPST